MQHRIYNGIECAFKAASAKGVSAERRVNNQRTLNPGQEYEHP